MKKKSEIVVSRLKDKFVQGDCYCPSPVLTEDSFGCKLCGGKNPKLVLMKVKK
jgi:hypothetical protein